MDIGLHVSKLLLDKDPTAYWGSHHLPADWLDGGQRLNIPLSGRR
jgi:hypothetical protein